MDRRGVIILLLTPLLTSVLLSGCSAGGASYVKSKFRDADQRIAQAADGGYSEFWEIVVPPATPALTIRASFLADQGISFSLSNPAGRRTTSFAYPGAAEVPEMSWIEARRPAAGSWRMSIDCGRRCDFSFGFYLQDAVPKVEDVPPTYSDATIRFFEDTDGSSSRTNQFRLPPNVTQLALRMSVDSKDSFAFRLEDPTGNRRAATSFPTRAHVDNAAYVIMDAPPAGTWNFRADCRDGCSYGVGVFVK